MYKWYYSRLKVKEKLADGEVYLLSEGEVADIKKRERKAIIWAAVIGAVAVLALYIPQYLFPEWFPINSIKVPFLAEPLNISITALIFGMILVFIEILFLTFLNIYSAHEIAVSTGYLTKENKNSNEKRDLLLTLGQEKKTKEIKSLGIDPYHGLKKGTVLIMTSFFTLKATLSNIIVRLLIQKILGRYAVRQVLDMIGIPIFAFWNAFGTRKVLRQARIVLMGMNYLEQLEKDLKHFRTLNHQEKTLLYDTLLYIAMSKRDFHLNHYLLAKLLMKRFEIPSEKMHVITKNYIELVANSAQDFKELNEKMILLGFALDGSLSMREKFRIKKLNEQNILTHSVNQTDKLVKNFVYGKGLF